MNLDAERMRRAALFPPGTACQSCGEGDPLLLIPDARLFLCAHCDAARWWRLPVEGDHIAGQRNGKWIRNIPVDVHRRITVRQRAWLKRMPDAPPEVRSHAARLHGLADMHADEADRLHQRAEALERGER